MIKREETNLIIDCFAGGGGASVGIEMAFGRAVDIAINHDPGAILMHQTNHPKTLHLTEDIFKVNLQKYVNGRHVALLWASPDCRHFSKAKGGKPKSKSVRMLPWAVYKHAKAILPDVICMENVMEIQQWGPLDDDGIPIPGREGEEYMKFIASMRDIGYDYDCRELVAADYGVPTTRKRWYAVFRRDGLPIVWPEPTHSKGGTDGKKKWVPVSTCLDLSDFGTSIFGRKKPLADKTLKRIARGLKKFVIENEDPFIVVVNHGGDTFRGQSKDDPLQTITAKHGYGAVNVHKVPIIAPYIDKSYGGNYSGAGSSADDPSPTITTVDHNRLITPYLTPIGYGEREGQKPRVNSPDEPIGTIVGTNKHYMTAPYLIQYHSEKSDKEVRGQIVSEPVQTIDTSNRYAEVATFISKFYRTGSGQSMTEPIHTITTSAGHFGLISVLTVPFKSLLENGVDEETAQKCTWVSEFIVEYYGQGLGQGIDVPLHTIVSRDRFALITVLGNEYAIMDIYLRMLKPEELKLAQGFPRDYIIDRDYKWNTYPKSEQVKRIGNSVSPKMAELIVKANCPYLIEGRREPAPIIYYQPTGQMAFA